MNYARIWSAFHSQVWALLPSKFAELEAFFEAKCLGRGTPVSLDMESDGAPQLQPQRGRVTILPVFGVLTNRAGMVNDISGATSYETLGKWIASAVADPEVSAIVLDVDSPGGSALGLAALAAQIRESRERKRIVAVVDDLCASAAYYIAAQASQIVAVPDAIVGSIGIIQRHVEFSEANKMAGIKSTIIRRPEHKAEGNETEPLSDEARAHMQALVDEKYAQFVADVAAGRGVSAEKVETDYGQGRVVTASMALTAGMVDRIGTLREVLAELSAAVTPGYASAMETRKRRSALIRRAALAGAAGGNG